MIKNKVKEQERRMPFARAGLCPARAGLRPAFGQQAAIWSVCDASRS
jgi:hypothetical protein